MNDAFWGEMITVLKDISSYLEKQDTTQEKANIEPAPRMQEAPKIIEGGPAPSGKPGEGFAKNYVPVEDEDKKEDEIEEVSDEKTLDEDAVEEVSADEEDDKDKDIDELKSLLKDIRSALMKQSEANVGDVIKSELKKSLPNVVKTEIDKMLRKQGFLPTRPDVVKLDSKSLGLDMTQEVKKSEDIVKSEDKKDDIQKILEDMSKKSWNELGQMREKLDGFSPFAR